MRRSYFILIFIACICLAQTAIAQDTQPLTVQQPISVEQPEGDKFMTEFMNMLTTLGLIVVFIFLVTWFLKRMLNVKIQQMNTTSLIKIIERRALSPKTAIYLLEIGGKEIAIGESPQGITLLGDFNTAQESAPSKNFQEILEKKLNEPKT